MAKSRSNCFSILRVASLGWSVAFGFGVGELGGGGIVLAVGGELGVGVVVGAAVADVLPLEPSDPVVSFAFFGSEQPASAAASSRTANLMSATPRMRRK
jgi:hypothetical protein